MDQGDRPAHGEGWEVVSSPVGPPSTLLILRLVANVRLAPASQTNHAKNSERWTIPYTGRSRPCSAPCQSSTPRLAMIVHQTSAAMTHENATNVLTFSMRRQVSASTHGA